MAIQNQRVTSLTTFYLIGGFIAFTISLYFQAFKFISKGIPMDFGFIPAHVIVRGLTPWFTSLFYHGGVSHIISNSIPLIVFGLPLERELGIKRYLLLFFGCGFFGHFALILFKRFSMSPHIGASGAVMGIIVYFICGAIVETRKLKKGTGLDIWMVMALVLFVLPNLIGFTSEIGGAKTSVSQLAHLGGGVGGFLFFDLFYNNRRGTKFLGK